MTSLTANAFGPKTKEVRGIPGFAGQAAFSLIEMLTVIAIIGILSVGVTVAIPTILVSRNMSNAVDTINGYLNFARAHAMADNTYVIVCFSLPSTSGHTDLQMISYSSLNGTFTPGATAAVQSSKVIHVPNVSLCAYGSLGSNITSALTGASITGTDLVTATQPATVDCLTYYSANSGAANTSPTIAPPGSTTSTGPYAFSELIAFSPQGEALLVPPVGTAIGPTTPFYSQIFLGICPCRSGVPVAASPDSSTLILDGGTGHVVIYRS